MRVMIAAGRLFIDMTILMILAGGILVTGVLAGADHLVKRHRGSGPLSS